MASTGCLWRHCDSATRIRRLGPRLGVLDAAGDAEGPGVLLRLARVDRGPLQGRVLPDRALDFLADLLGLNQIVVGGFFDLLDLRLGQLLGLRRTVDIAASDVFEHDSRAIPAQPLGHACQVLAAIGGIDDRAGQDPGTLPFQASQPDRELGVRASWEAARDALLEAPAS